MYRYVLSDCRTTTDVVEYVKDVFAIELNLVEGDIPYYECGIDVVDDSIVRTAVEDSIKTRLTQLVSGVSARNPFVTMNLTSITFGRDTIEITIRINETDTQYSLKKA
jgi:hypothetical protein